MEYFLKTVLSTVESSFFEIELLEGHHIIY